jgi:hypothetical protein
MILIVRPLFLLLCIPDGTALFKVESQTRLFLRLLSDFVTLGRAMALGIAAALVTCVSLLAAEFLRLLSRNSKEERPS